MPPAALHCLVHLTPAEMLKERFPAIYAIKFSEPGSPEHYTLGAMVIWATVPYIIWQTIYHCFITVRRAEQIAAGRPTSFTWLRKSHANTLLGKFVLSLPESMQSFAFMFIQYGYALLTMLPCPFWFWYRNASAGFLIVVFIWSIYNGATYYIDVFGKRFQKELEQLKKDVARWQASPEGMMSPLLTPAMTQNQNPMEQGTAAQAVSDKANIDRIPPLDAAVASTGAQEAKPSDDATVRERK